MIPISREAVLKEEFLGSEPLLAAATAMAQNIKKYIRVTGKCFLADLKNALKTCIRFPPYHQAAGAGKYGCNQQQNEEICAVPCGYAVNI